MNKDKFVSRAKEVIRSTARVRSFVIRLIFVSLPESSDVLVAYTRDDQDSLGWVLPNAALQLLGVISKQLEISL